MSNVTGSQFRNHFKSTFIFRKFAFSVLCIYLNGEHLKTDGQALQTLRCIGIELSIEIRRENRKWKHSYFPFAEWSKIHYSNYYRPRSREIMLLVVSIRLTICTSVRPSIHPFVRPSVRQRSHAWTVWPTTLKFETKMKRAEKSHYQSKVFVCVSNNRTNMVDQLLISCVFMYRYLQHCSILTRTKGIEDLCQDLK